MSAAGSVRETLGRERLLGILRYPAPGDLAGAIGALVTGGVRVFEVTLDTPGAVEAITTWSAREDVCVGAGTVTTTEDVRRVADAGAAFVVSPGLDTDVVEAALARGLCVLPGVATATEVLAARRAGAEIFKLFPAGALGTSYLGQLRGPFPFEAFVPTGGVRVADIGSWLDTGAFAVALGSDLAGREAPVDDVQLAELTTRARSAVDAVAASAATVARTSGGKESA